MDHETKKQQQENYPGMPLSYFLLAQNIFKRGQAFPWGGHPTNSLRKQNTTTTTSALSEAYGCANESEVTMRVLVWPETLFRW